MKPQREKNMKILVVDVGGSHVKCVATDHNHPVKFKSGPRLTPDRMARRVLKITKGGASMRFRSAIPT